MTIGDPSNNENKSVLDPGNVGEESPDLFSDSEADTVLMSDEENVVYHPEAVLHEQDVPRARSPSVGPIPPLPPLPSTQPSQLITLPPNQPISGIVGNTGIIYKPTTVISSIIGSILSGPGELATSASAEVSRERTGRSPGGSSQSPGGTTSNTFENKPKPEGWDSTSKNNSHQNDSNQVLANAQRTAGNSGDIPTANPSTYTEEAGLQAAHGATAEVVDGVPGAAEVTGSGDETGHETGTEGPNSK